MKQLPCSSLPVDDNLRESVGKFWYANDPVKTYFFNSLALFLPPLEKMVVLSLKKSLKESKVTDDLKSKVSQLVKEEANHSREYRRFVEETVTPHYFLQTQSKIMNSLHYLAAFIHRLSPTFHYALSAAGEHFTAISAVFFLTFPQCFKDMPPSIYQLWYWHCIEEYEHRTVAFDVFQTLNGNYFIRIIAFLLMTIIFIIGSTLPMLKMMHQDKITNKWSTFLKVMRYLWGKQGIFRHLLKPYGQYFKPSFHPKKLKL